MKVLVTGATGFLGSLLVRELLRSFEGQKTVFLSTHILPQVENTCSRIIIIRKGQLMAQGKASELRQSPTGTRLVTLGVLDHFITDTVFNGAAWIKKFAFSIKFTGKFGAQAINFYHWRMSYRGENVLINHR